MRIRRIQPPVGYPVSFSALRSSALKTIFGTGHDRETFERGFAEHLGVRHTRAISSGKAALTLLLLAMYRLNGRTKVIVPAYTCYSVPSAIVKAGLEVVPCDVARGSFDYDFEQLAPMLRSDVLAVLSVHLFGIAADTRRLNTAAKEAGIFVIEDCAQALGGTRNGEFLGAAGDAGFFSLGRGKNVTCGSGGIVVTSDERIAAALNEVATRLMPTSPAQDVSTFVALLLLGWFISPRLYWFPAGLPFLRLGETIFHEQFPMRWLSDFQAALLRDWSTRLAQLDAARRVNSKHYLAHITGARSYGEDIPYLRFPVILPGGPEKHYLLVEADGGALGMSGMYPASVAAIPQLRDRLAGARFPEAERVAASLVTLPTHPLVSDRDRERIESLVNDVLGPSTRSRNVRVDAAVTGAPAH